MDTLPFWIGVLGNIVSVLVFLSPVKTFVRIVKHGSTEEFDCLPYICTLLNSCLWTYYGVTKPGSYLVATVNGFGVVVELVYVALFLAFAPPMKRAKTGVVAGIVNVGFLGAAIGATGLMLEREEDKINAIGFMCAGLNIIMYASPLAVMKRVVRRKSVEYMPFLLSLFLFVNGGIWLFYGLLVQDWFVGVPNGIGFVLGTIQLLLYALYRNGGKPPAKLLLPPDSATENVHTDPLLLPEPSQTC